MSCELLKAQSSLLTAKKNNHGSHFNTGRR